MLIVNTTAEDSNSAQIASIAKDRMKNESPERLGIAIFLPPSFDYFPLLFDSRLQKHRID